MHNHHDAAIEVAKSAPPVAVSGLSLVGVQLNDLVLMATLLWLACQIGGWIYDRFIREKSE